MKAKARADEAKKVADRADAAVPYIFQGSYDKRQSVLVKPSRPRAEGRLRFSQDQVRMKLPYFTESTMRAGGSCAEVFATCCNPGVLAPKLILRIAAGKPPIII